MEFKLYIQRIFVKNWEDAIDFYSKKLKMKVHYKNKESGWAEVEIGNDVYLGIERIDLTDIEYQKLVGRFTGLSLRVKDIEQAYKSLSSKGVKFQGKPKKQSWGGIMAHFEDTDENILTLIELSR